MRAVVFDRHGPPEVLTIREVADPVARPAEVVVNIIAASVNAVDWKVRKGVAESLPSVPFPHILGRDFSGVVAAVGESVHDLRVGDEVFGVCDVGREGAYAEKIAVEAAILARKPSFLSHVEAAALAVSGLTGLVSIEDCLKLRRGERILILGGAGGVGSFAVQLAAHIGAEVATTASEANHEYLRRVGARHTIDYHTTDFAEVIKDYDAGLDTVGGADKPRIFQALRAGGRAAFVAGLQPAQPPRPDLIALRPDVRRDRPHLERVVALVKAGAIVPPEIVTFDFDDVVSAHRVSESRRLRGKLVLRVRR